MPELRWRHPDTGATVENSEDGRLLEVLGRRFSLDGQPLGYLTLEKAFAAPYLKGLRDAGVSGASELLEHLETHGAIDVFEV